MYNTDTLSVSMSFRRKEEKTGKLDLNYIYRVQNKIMNKLVLYKQDKINREREIRYNNLSNENKEILAVMRNNKRRNQKPIYWHGKYNDYVFTYNENWQSLTIMLPNNKVEDYTAEEIKSNVTNAIIEYFCLEPEDLNELVVNRIDVHCDYNFDDKEEFLIIRNILQKAPDRFYTYTKYLLKDDKDGYILKYLAVRKKKYVQELISMEDELLEIDKWKEKKNNENNA